MIIPFGPPRPECSNCGPAGKPPGRSALLDLSPKTARRADGGDGGSPPGRRPTRRPAPRIRPGEAVPVDGPSSLMAVPPSMSVTGGRCGHQDHGRPRHRGTINGSGGDGSRKVGIDTMLSRIVAMVSKRNAPRTHPEDVADRVRLFVPVVIVIAARRSSCGPGRTRAATRLRPRRCRRRADHRLPLRTRTGHTHVDRPEDGRRYTWSMRASGEG